jgi:hypothetical protein
MNIDKSDLKKVREEFQESRPSLDDLISSGEWEGPYNHGQLLESKAVFLQLLRYCPDAKLDEFCKNENLFVWMKQLLDFVQRSRDLS